MNNLGLIFAIVSPLLSSIATIFKSGAVKILGPFSVLSIGSLFGGLLVLIFLFIKHRGFKFENIKNNFKDLLLLILTRQILGELLFTIGLGLTLSSKAIFLTKVEPYFVLFWYWFFRKEPIKSYHLVLLTIHIAGAIVLSTGGVLDNVKFAQLGDVLIILAMGFFSLSYFPATKVTNKIGALQTNTIMLITSGLVFLPFIFLSNFKGVEIVKGWIYLLAYSTIFVSIGLTLWFASLKTVKGWMVSAFRSIGPLAGLPLAYFLFDEKLTLVQIIGGIIVIATSFLIAKEHFKFSKR